MLIRVLIIGLHSSFGRQKHSTLFILRGALLSGRSNHHSKDGQLYCLSLRFMLASLYSIVCVLPCLPTLGLEDYLTGRQ